MDVPYRITGSVASSILGVARTTLDIDLVADLGAENVVPLVRALEDSYYVEESAVRDAVDRKTSLNVIHLDTMLKVDLFVLKSDPYEREAFSRGRSHELGAAPECRSYPVGAPEDVILDKLVWFRAGGESSDRQWRDVLGVVEIQGETLDRAYLARWAAHLDVTDLLRQALDEVG
jgi:hypothetical protein